MQAQFSVFRYNPEKDATPRYQEYEVTVEKGTTVLRALRTIKDEQDGTLSFRWSCASSICGSCAVTINGRNMLACKTQVTDLKGRRIVIEPLAGMPVIRDLVVDFDPFFAGLAAIKPYQINDDEPPAKERLQDPEVRKAYDDVAQCILCGACTSSCPVGWTDSHYLGPAAMAKVWRFVADDRDHATAERLDMVNNEVGVWRCRTMFRCVDACPKDVDTTGAIEKLRQRIMRRELTGEVD